MNLRRALLLSIGIHLAATGLIGGLVGWLTAPSPEAPASDGRQLVLNLVDPVEVVPEEFAETDSSAPGGASTSRALRPGAPEVGEVAPAGSAAGADAGASGRERRRLSDAPSTEQLAEVFGLDLDGMPEPFVDRLFPVMLKYHYQGDAPTASTYRQLLRSYIDGHMGYPHAVTGPLRANRNIRFLAWIEILVQADGSFQVDAMLMNEDVDDPDGVMSAFYRRILDEAARMPFLPPSDAGLPAPHRLAYRLVNPERR